MQIMPMKLVTIFQNRHALGLFLILSHMNLAVAGFDQAWNTMPR